MDEHLLRIRTMDSGIGAFREVLADQALRDADTLGRRPDLASLPLAGVPIAVKDNLPLKGVATRNGSAATSDTPARRDHETVRRLKEAGAIVIGVTTVPELCVFGTTDGVLGVTRNPWDRGMSAGGSSGGSAAAVAAGMVPIALGSDGMGSIRIPAASCGVVGLKPGEGLVPRDLGSNGWFGMAENGPIARSVEDTRHMLAVLSGDASIATAPADTQPMRVAVSLRPPTPHIRVAPEWEAAAEAAGLLLAACGHEVTSAELPTPLWLGRAAMTRWMAGTAADAQGLDPNLLTSRTRTHAAVGRAVAFAGMVKPAHRDRWRARLEKFFNSYDVVLTPALAGPPPAAREWHTKSWLANIRANLAFAPFSFPWNLAGWPALVVPMGMFHSRETSLPLSVQLAAPTGMERTLLQLASQLERMRP
ncbi:amidase family protein [Streptomyces sp. NPDC051909]|uniref:amidase n=1 Tax=Streptomyces sp. NPDC051909 TaxID=3154944 RepID=UPI00341A8A56